MKANMAFLVILFSFFVIIRTEEIASCDTIVSANITTDTTWTLSGSPYIVTIPLNVGATVPPTLTIQAGVTVKFQANSTLKIGYNDGVAKPAYIKILGTATSPVLLTADTPTPAQDFWVGVYLNSYTLLPSTIQYTHIEYAQSALRLDQIAPEVHSCTFRNSHTGLLLFGPLVLNTYQNSFIGNTQGLIQSNATVSAILSWWDHISGPSGGGSGSGQFVSGGVKYEPWLEAIPTYTNELISASTVNKTFNPNGGVNHHVNFSSVVSANWTFTYINSSSQIVRTFTGTGQSTNIVWDGKNDSGVLQTSGTYTYRIQSSGSATATGKATMSLTQTPAISSATVNPTYMSPDNDGVKDTTAITATFNFDGGQWTVNIKNSGGTIVRTSTASGLSFSWVFDGKDSAGTTLPDAVYTVEFKVIDDSANLTTTKTLTVDVTDPVAIITSPTPNQVASNIYHTSLILISGTATDLNFLNWTLSRCNPSCGSFASSSSPKNNGVFYSWDTTTYTNQSLSLKLDVLDNAGNKSTVIVPLSVGNFNMTQNVRQINASAGQTVSYSLTIPFSLNANAYIKNSVGTNVRTLYNGSLDTGAPPLVFNGRDNSNNLLLDGPYFIIVDITKDTSNYTWDQTNQSAGTSDTFAYPSATTNWDPYNNNPLSIPVTLPDPRRVTVEIGNIFTDDCSAPSICLVNGDYQPSGTYTFVWTGVDDQGILRPDLRFIGIAARQTNFPKNAVLIFGTKPVISNLTVTPSFFRPSLGTQNITFNLATYQNQPANVTVTFFNQASRSILRTINQNNVAVGPVSISWNGLADNGMRVSNDPYLITVTATDAIGQQATAKALMQIRY